MLRSSQLILRIWKYDTGVQTRSYKNSKLLRSSVEILENHHEVREANSASQNRESGAFSNYRKVTEPEKANNVFANWSFFFPHHLKQTVRRAARQPGNTLSNRDLLLVLDALSRTGKTADTEFREQIIELVWSLRHVDSVTVSHYNAYLNARIANGLELDEKKCLQQMQSLGFQPNAVTYQHFVENYCKKGQIEKALEMVNKQNLKTKSVYNALLGGYFKAGEPDKAQNLLSAMQTLNILPDLETFTALAVGYAERGDDENVMKLLSENKFSGAQILKIVTSTKSEDLIEKLLLEVSFEDVTINEAKNCCVELIDTGQLTRAKLIFEKLLRPLGQRAVFFGEQMAKSNYPIEDVSAFVNSLEDETEKSEIMRAATRGLFARLDTPSALEYLQLAHDFGTPIREHFFFPAICRAKYDDEIFVVLGKMEKLGVPIEEDTLRFVFRNLRSLTPQDSVARLAKHGVAEKMSKKILLERLILTESLKECLDYVHSFDVEDWKPWIPSLARLTTPGNILLSLSIVRKITTANPDCEEEILKAFEENLSSDPAKSRFQSIKPTLNESFTCKVQKPDVGEDFKKNEGFTYDLDELPAKSQKKTSSRNQTTELGIKSRVDHSDGKFDHNSFKTSPENAVGTFRTKISESFAAKSKISCNDETNGFDDDDEDDDYFVDDIDDESSYRYSKKITPKNLRPANKVNFSDPTEVVTYDQEENTWLKESVSELSEKDVNSLTVACMKRDSATVENLLKRLDVDKLKRNSLFSLLGFYVSQKNLAKALYYYEKLKLFDETKIEAWVIISLSTLMIENSRFQEARQLLLEYPFTKSSMPVRAAGSKASALVTVMIKYSDMKATLEMVDKVVLKLVDLKPGMLQPIIEHTIETQPKRLLDVFIMLYSKYGVFSGILQLHLFFIKTKNEKDLGKLSQLLTNVHGELKAKTMLASAYISLRDRKKSLETLQQLPKDTKTEAALERMAIALLNRNLIPELEVAVDVAINCRFNCDGMIFALAQAYDKENNCEKASRLWEQCQESNLVLPTRTLRKLALIFENNGKKPPFALHRMS